MKNIDNYKEYTDKFSISLLDLKNIDNATETDKIAKLDLWAKMFNAHTWEELKEVAAQSPMIDKAVGYMYTMTKDEEIRMQMEAREEYYKNERTNQRLLKEAREEAEHYKQSLEQAVQTSEQYKQTSEQYKKMAEERGDLLAEYERRFGKL